ncbi:MAG: glycoside hydrolase 43 family protein [Gemmatimonadaceae bacterium]
MLAKPLAGQGWDPNLAGDRYRNPIIFADYSEPDVVRVGNDFYLTSSSFGDVPGLPILHSRDLVNWTIIGHALPKLYAAAFDTPQHGNGVWAPSLRLHNGQFYIYWGDPDRGIYVVRARDPRGPWDTPLLVKEAKGWIDPAPLWDDDGNAYLVHAFANSRAGIKSELHVAQLNADGTRVIGDDKLVFDGHAHYPTIEGPKFYKRNGGYYIFAPAGGVPTGWQTVLRSRTVYGPYEDRVVLAQGSTSINGPHQGAWVATALGEDWFVHFQDRGAYGRIVHLEPMTWANDWPVIGVNPNSDGVGEPVTEHARPRIGNAKGAMHACRKPRTNSIGPSVCSGSGKRIRLRRGIRCRSGLDGCAYVRSRSHKAP